MQILICAAKCDSAFLAGVVESGLHVAINLVTLYLCNNVNDCLKFQLPLGRA